jgi:hypothetical protein
MLGAAALVPPLIAATAHSTPSAHPVKLDIAMFAAQVGSTSAAGEVYAGELVDRRLDHGAIVFNASGTTNLRVSFHAFFTSGSIEGSGRVTLIPGASGRATFKGRLKITGGTSAYRHASGSLTTAGNLDSTGTADGTLKGSFARNQNPPSSDRPSNLALAVKHLPSHEA